MISVGANSGAIAALQQLASTNRDLQSSQLAVASGKRVSSVKDNGAVWATANRMSAEASALDVVRSSVDRATGILEAATAAGESIMEILVQMRSITAVDNSNWSNQSYLAMDREWFQLRNQMWTILENANFDGKNLWKTFSQADSVTVFGDTKGGNLMSLNGGMASLIPYWLSGYVFANPNLNPPPPDTDISRLNFSIDVLAQQLSVWGAQKTRLESQRASLDKFSNTVRAGIGAVTDTDLSTESAKLQSLQMKQQLGVQALSIANRSGQAALTLFR